MSRSRVSGSGEVDHGSIWRKEGVRFVREHSFGAGAEIASLVDQFRESPGAARSRTADDLTRSGLVGSEFCRAEIGRRPRELQRDTLA